MYAAQKKKKSFHCHAVMGGDFLVEADDSVAELASVAD